MLKSICLVSGPRVQLSDRFENEFEVFFILLGIARKPWERQWE
jgi:hypothetical protein